MPHGDSLEQRLSFWEYVGLVAKVSIGTGVGYLVTKGITYLVGSSLYYQIPVFLTTVNLTCYALDQFIYSIKESNGDFKLENLPDDAISNPAKYQKPDFHKLVLKPALIMTGISVGLYLLNNYLF